MKEKLLSNIGIKILAVILAVILWMLIANIDDYSITKQIKNIPVEAINGESITNQDMVYDIVEGDTVDIVIKGRRKVVDYLSAEDFVAEADLSKLSITNAAQIKVEPVKSSLNSELEITYKNNMLVISVEEKDEKQLPVTVVTDGNPLSGYAVGTKAATPNMVTISGAASIIKKVKEVHVLADVNNKNASFTTDAKPIYYDANGDVVDSRHIECSIDSINVSVAILQTKEVPIELSTVGEVDPDYVVTSIVSLPTAVKIAGASGDLTNVTKIIIDDISIDGLRDNLEKAVDIDDYLPEGIILADDNQQIMIKITLEKIEEKTIDITSKDIAINNKKDLYSYTILLEEESSVSIKGLINDIKDVDISKLSPYIDVESLDVGTYTIPVIFADIENVANNADLKVKIKIEKIDNSSSDSNEKTPETTQDTEE